MSDNLRKALKLVKEREQTMGTIQKDANIIRKVMLAANMRRELNGVDGIDIWNDIKPSYKSEYDVRLPERKKDIFLEFVNADVVKIEWF